MFSRFSILFLLVVCYTVVAGCSNDADTKPRSVNTEPVNLTVCLNRIETKQQNCQVPAGNQAEEFRSQWCQAAKTQSDLQCFEEQLCGDLMPVIINAGFPCLEQITKIDLPNGYQPEGIAKGRDTLAYVGTLTGGGVIEVDLRSGSSKFLVTPVGKSEGAIAGLAYDAVHHHIFACGAWFENGFVFDATTGDRLATMKFPKGSLINSVVLTGSEAFFTDSNNAVFYRLPIGNDGLPAGEPQAVKLSGDFQMVAATNASNANGMVAIPASNYLLIVNTSNGILYRVDADTGASVAINLQGQLLPFGDGLLMDAGLLYVVHTGVENKISVLSLNGDFTQGKLERIITSADFQGPTNAVKMGNALWVVNARNADVFHGDAQADDPFNLIRIGLD